MTAAKTAAVRDLTSNGRRLKSPPNSYLFSVNLATLRPCTLGDFLLSPLDLCFKLIADLQLVFDEILQPFADRFQILERERRQRRLDFFDRAHGSKFAELRASFKYESFHRGFANLRCVPKL